MTRLDAPDRENPAEGERPTLKTIAFMTGLGVTTVSRALKDAPDIALETRKRVQLVARQVGYRPNRAGVRLRTGKTNVISLILDTKDQVGGFMSQIVYGVSELLADTPYHLVITPYSRDNDPMTPVRYIVETGSADGVIISRTEPNDRRVRYLSEHGFPFVTHGRTSMGVDHAYHDFDNAAYSTLAVRRLIELGRTRLALLAPPSGLSYHDHMWQGFQDAVLAGRATEVPIHGLTLDSALDAVRDGIEKLMRQTDRPDGIVAGSDSAALAIAAGIDAASLTIGRDIDMVSKQTFKLMELARPQVHVVDEDMRLAGRELARALLAAIAGAPISQLQTLATPVAVRERS